MKIHQIQFKNINNLKGEHSISFDQVPLSTAGIFAIVGPTGSGKSTILDVITLALFNRIPRFKKAITKSEITNEGSVVTHHTTEASATIDYEIKGRKYRSSWSVATNRNGKLKDYEMTFYNPDGSVADLKRSEVPSHNEKIIGLKYDQFIKSILLSQGQFSKFLKADKNERGQLLENITGTSIYRSIGIKTYEKYKVVKDSLEREKEIIGVISTLSDEDRSALDTELKQSKEEKEKLDNWITEATTLKQIKTDILRIKNTLVDKEQKAQGILLSINEFKSSQLKLDTHQKLSNIQGELALYNKAHINVQKSTENLKEYNTQLETSKANLKRTIDDMAQLTKSEVTESNFKKIMSAFEAEVNTMDHELKTLKTKGQETRDRANKQKANYPTPISDNIQEAIAQLSERKSLINQTIKEANINPKQSLIQNKQQLKEQQKELVDLQSIQKFYEQEKERESKLKNLNKEYTNFELTKEKNTPLLQKTNELINAAIREIELLVKQKEDAIKIANLEDLRNELVSGSPCPLCGSTSHPYSEHNPENHKSAIDEKIKSTQIQQQKNQNELHVIQKELTECETSMHRIQTSIKELKANQSHAEEENQEIIKKYSGKSAPNPESTQALIVKLTSTINLNERAIESITENQLNKDLQESYTHLNAIGQEYKTLKQKRLEKFEGSEINLVTNKLQDNFEISKSKITEVTAVINKETQSLKRDEELVESIEKELSPKIKKLGFTDIKEISTHLLDESTLLLINQKKDQLSKQQTTIETEIKTLKSDLTKQIEKDKKSDLTLESLVSSLNEKTISRDNFNKTYITNQERLKRDDQDRIKIKSKEKAIIKLNLELEKWALLNKMIGDATGNKFANFAQGLTLQNLLVYANRRLMNLSDRYLLDKPESDGALTIIDKYQGNTSRSVTTLSGGESFLISLALALSLSDMASKNVALECLFIDEGFGTLDPDTLETAMNTLEKLQSESQKMVGVISHVEALKERINVQIRLKKNAQGYSQIEVEG